MVRVMEVWGWCFRWLGVRVRGLWGYELGLTVRV